MNPSSDVQSVPAVPRGGCILLYSSLPLPHVAVPNSSIFASPYAIHRAAKLLSRLLGMAVTDPSATTKESPSQLARVVRRHARSRSHLTLVTSRRHDDNVAGRGLPAERINQCMLLLLIICVVLAGSMLAVVGYLARE